METSFSEKLHKHKLQNVNSMINRYNLLSKLTFGGDTKEEEPWKPYQDNTTTSTYTAPKVVSEQNNPSYTPIKNLNLSTNLESAYIQNWLNNRREQLNKNMKSKYFDPLSPGGFQTMYHTVTDKKREEINEEFYRQFNNINTVKVYKNNREASREIKDWPNSYNPFYYPRVHAISLGDSDEKYKEVHEKVHSSNPFPQERAISNIINTKENIEYKENNKDVLESQKNYLYDPSEVYPRIMTMRYNNNIDPKKIINTQDVKNLRKNYKRGDRDLFDMFNDKTIKKLLNDIAYNNKTNKDVNNRYS